MTRSKTPENSGRGPAKAPAQSREDRLKAALKANMGKRKAQARARAAADQDEPAAGSDENGTG